MTSFDPYQDWLAAKSGPAMRRWRLAADLDSAEVRRMVHQVLEVGGDETVPAAVATEARWEADGVAGERLSWDVGYGPRTEAYLLRPSGAHGPWPGVVALHCHSGFKWYGKEKIADGATGPAPGLGAFRQELYGGRAYANELAKAGFVVLVHDVFMWGSRRFVLAEDRELPLPAAEKADAYNRLAVAHEHVVEKYCRLLGTTVAAVVAREDRAAVAYLAGRPEVKGQRIGCIGLSGGGLRAGMLHASSAGISATVVVGMMATYSSLLGRHVAGHTWMLFPAGWTDQGDWPDLVGCRPELPLMVQYNEDDPLFPPDGMHAADDLIRRRYARSGAPGSYEGLFFPGGHKFDQPMQAVAFAWLDRALRSSDGCELS